MKVFSTCAVTGLRGFGEELLGELLEVLELRRHGVELLAGEGGLQLDHFGERLGGEQILGEGERGVAMRLGRVDRLAAEVERAVTGGLVGILDEVGGVLGDALHLRIGLARLGNALLGEFADGVRHLERRCIDLEGLKGVVQSRHGGFLSGRHLVVLVVLGAVAISELHWLVR